MKQAFKWSPPDLFSPNWRHWGEESVLFDAASGDTHLVDAVASSLLIELASRALSTDELLAMFGEDLLPDAHAAAHKYLSALLAGLEAKNLVRRLPE